MIFGRVKRLARGLTALFPERHLLLHSGEGGRRIVLTPRRQMTAVGVLALCFLWMGASTAAVTVDAISHARGVARASQTQAQAVARYGHWLAARQARIETVTARLDTPATGAADPAHGLEQRDAALALLLAAARGTGSPPPPAPVDGGGAPPQARIAAVERGQERLIAAADAMAKSRADRLRSAFRLAGLKPAAYTRGQAAMGGPLIEVTDPRALAALLHVDESFARRIHSLAAHLSDTRDLVRAARTLPLARPTQNTSQTSGFGVRVDPFTGKAAFHSGLDFAGAVMTPIHATAAGVVAFTGERSGYGHTIEIDHGAGFLTRYGHLARIGVRPGQRILLGQTIGGMGSTGRSTGTHLHYEVWVNGRVQNPMRFVKAGDSLPLAG